MMSHNLAEFALNVPAGFTINIEPPTHIFLPIVNKHFIENITIRVIDQDSRLINFRGENIVVILELRKENF